MKLIRSHKLTVLLVVFSSIIARASTARTYVSVNGNDGNTGIGCPVTAPCRSFVAALGVTSPYGEIVAVDSGDYSPVTITQSVTIKAGCQHLFSVGRCHHDFRSRSRQYRGSPRAEREWVQYGIFWNSLYRWRSA